MVPCKFFAQGFCKWGEYCRFQHEGKPCNSNSLNLRTSLPFRTESATVVNQEAVDAAVTTSLSDLSGYRIPGPCLAPILPHTRSKIPCRFFATGNCKNGENCPYAHAEQNEVALVGDDEEKEAFHDDFRRELGGSVVEFQSGASVSKVSIPADFSAACIRGLPAGSSPKRIATSLSKIGIELDLDCVRVSSAPNSTGISAQILVEDPSFAKLLCTAVAQKSKLPPELVNVEATPIPPRLSPGSSARRIECKKVQCSWFKATTTAWLNFETERAAKRVFSQFEGRAHRVLGQTVQCRPPTRSQARIRSRCPWTLMLTDLPVTITASQITSAIIEPSEKPRHVELGRPSYEMDGEESSACVLSLLSQQGTIEWSQANTQLPGRRAKAVARFYEESDARKAAKALDNQALPFGKKLTIAAQLVSTAKFKVEDAIFKATKSRIQTANELWTAQNLRFKVYPCAGASRQYRIVKIEGQVAEHVAAAKEELDIILDGIKLEEKGKPLWGSSLESKSTSQKFRQVEEKFGVVIIRDTRKLELRLCASTQSFQEAELAIRRIISAESTESTGSRAINLDAITFRWACKGGFRMLVDTLGEGALGFDVISKRILVNGSNQDYNVASKLIKNRDLSLIKETSAAKSDCPVCFGPAESPVKMTCGHMFCTDCFEGLCAHAGSDAVPFPVRCPSEACDHVFDLDKIQENLSSKAFENLLEFSFSSFIKRHPLTFRYCPKPNCETIYRVSEQMQLSTCAKCLTRTCTRCHAQHADMSCAEYKDWASGGYAALERYKREKGIQDCPACSTPIEKVDGCNHMTCKGCGTHICWVCLAIFPESNACYTHMNKTHQSIGLDYLNVLG